MNFVLELVLRHCFIAISFLLSVAIMNNRGFWSSVAFIKRPNSSTEFVEDCSCFWVTWCSYKSCIKVVIHQQSPGLIALDMSQLVLRILNMSAKINSVVHLFSGVLNMTKHSSRMILKIPYFTVNSVGELVLRNKIRFVARVRNLNNCTVVPSGYCIEKCFLLTFWLLC